MLDKVSWLSRKRQSHTVKPISMMRMVYELWASLYCLQVSHQLQVPSMLHIHDLCRWSRTCLKNPESRNDQNILMLVQEVEMSDLWRHEQKSHWKYFKRVTKKIILTQSWNSWTNGQSRTQYIRHSKDYCFKYELKRKYRQNEWRKIGWR